MKATPHSIRCVEAWSGTLENEFNAEYLYRAIRKRNAAIKLVIMDHHLVVGVATSTPMKPYSAPVSPQLPAANLVDALRAIGTNDTRNVDRSHCARRSSLRDFVAAMASLAISSSTTGCMPRDRGLPCMRHNIKQIRQDSDQVFIVYNAKKSIPFYRSGVLISNTAFRLSNE